MKASLAKLLVNHQSLIHSSVSTGKLVSQASPLLMHHGGGGWLLACENIDKYSHSTFALNVKTATGKQHNFRHCTLLAGQLPYREPLLGESLVKPHFAVAAPLLVSQCLYKMRGGGK